MGNNISKKYLNSLKLNIFDKLDNFFTRYEGKYIDRIITEELKEIVGSSINSSLNGHQKNTDLLGDRQFRVLEYLKNYFEISRREYATMFGVSFMTAFRDLNQLERKKILIKTGRGRATKYLLK